MSTIATDQTATAVDPRELIAPGLFDVLVRRLAERENLDAEMAQRITDRPRHLPSAGPVPWETRAS